MAFIDEFTNKEDLILRDHLAIERTKLANERTLFSYIRTALYLLTAGIGIFEVKSIIHLRWLGTLCLIISLLILLIGIYRFLLMRKHLRGYVAESDKKDIG